MEETIAYSAVALLIGAMVLTGAYIDFSGDNVYFCEGRDLVVNCDRLSGTLKTCYTDTDETIGNLRCLDAPYWQKISNPQDYGNTSFTVKYEYTYTNKTIEVTKYHMVNESYKVPVYKNETDEVCCDPSNSTCFSCVGTNMTCADNECKDWTHQVFDHYKTEWHLVNESYKVEEQVPNNTSCFRTGVNVGGEHYKSLFVGGINVDNNEIMMMLVPPGCRNFDEYPKCEAYEIEKNACEIIQILQGDEE